MIYFLIFQLGDGDYDLDDPSSESSEEVVRVSQKKNKKNNNKKKGNNRKQKKWRGDHESEEDIDKILDEYWLFVLLIDETWGT